MVRQYADIVPKAAALHERSGDYAGAARLFARLGAHDADSVVAAEGEARALAMSGEPMLAVRRLDQFAERWRDEFGGAAPTSVHTLRTSILSGAAPDRPTTPPAAPSVPAAQPEPQPEPQPKPQPAPLPMAVANARQRSCVSARRDHHRRDQSAECEFIRGGESRRGSCGGAGTHHTRLARRAEAARHSGGVRLRVARATAAGDGARDRCRHSRGRYEQCLRATAR